MNRVRRCSEAGCYYLLQTLTTNLRIQASKLPAGRAHLHARVSSTRSTRPRRRHRSPPLGKQRPAAVVSVELQDAVRRDGGGEAVLEDDVPVDIAANEGMSSRTTRARAPRRSSTRVSRWLPRQEQYDMISQLRMSLSRCADVQSRLLRSQLRRPMHTRKAIVGTQ